MRLWKMRFLRAFVWIQRMSLDKIEEGKYSNPNGSISGQNYVEIFYTRFYLQK
jgi:hypothetical protein